jgi:hypothetical protein
MTKALEVLPADSVCLLVISFNALALSALSTSLRSGNGIRVGPGALGSFFCFFRAWVFRF